MLILTARFEMGQLVSTPGALAQIPEAESLQALSRHLNCDWGEMDPEDIATNNHAFEHGGRLFSAFNSKAGIRFYVITEADRSVTTILLPQEY